MWSLLIGENKTDDLLGYDTWLIGSYLLHNHFSYWLSTTCNFISIIRTCTYAAVNKSNMVYVRNFFNLFQVSLLNLISLQHCHLPVFHLDCTRWCRFTFLVHFSNKSQGFWSGTNISCVIVSANVMNPYTWLLVWQWYHFLLVSNTTAVTDHVCQIALNRTLSHEFEKWFEFSS